MVWKRLGAAAIAFFLIIFVVSWESDTTAEVCSVDKHTQHKECSAHNVAMVPLFYSGAVLAERGEAVIALFTVILAISTIGLWKATNRLWLAGEKQMELIAANSSKQSRDMQASIAAQRKAADAAMLSARAYIGIQLPILRVEPGHNGTGAAIVDGVQHEYLYVYTLNVRNLGRTEAIPVRLQVGFFVGENLPSEPTYAFNDSVEIDTIIKERPDEGVAFRISDYTGDFPIGTLKLIEAKATTLWFFCNIHYRDFMQEPHEAGFCWRWTVYQGKGDFRVDDTPAYNQRT